jgi:hypothetical protein
MKLSAECEFGAGVAPRHPRQLRADSFGERSRSGRCHVTSLPPGTAP